MPASAYVWLMKLNMVAKEYGRREHTVMNLHMQGGRRVGGGKRRSSHHTGRVVAYDVLAVLAYDVRGPPTPSHPHTYKQTCTHKSPTPTNTQPYNPTSHPHTHQHPYTHPHKQT